MHSDPVPHGPDVSGQRRYRSFVSVFLLLLSVLSVGDAAAAEPLALHLQHRATGTASEQTELLHDVAAWDPEKTAIVVCDMWDKHWCKGATARVAEMAPRMDAVLRAARERGVRIIHAPSGTMDFYADTPQRERAQDAPESPMPSPDGWRHLDELAEGKLPIDDSDGGCNCQPRCPDLPVSPWTRQIETLHIGPDDVITDSGAEVYNVLEAEGRDNVIVLGVHTNMCVLGRPFSIRANVMNGKQIVLMRDLTDTMYNARMPPYVNHFRGTELVVDHIEEHWCPTVTSADLIGGAPFRFAEDTRPHVVFLLHEKEYKTRETVPAFAEAELAAARQWKCTYLVGHELNDLPGLAVLADADLLFVSVRRQLLPPEQLAQIRAYCESGRPVVAIRTASHAFAERNGNVPEGGAAWPEFDAEILGGHYTGHHGNDLQTRVHVAAGVTHPILEGVDPAERDAAGSLYKVSPLADTTTVLMTGYVAGEPAEPVAWTNTGKYGNRVFYTSLGHPGEFGNAAFRRLLLNGILWALESEATAAVVAENTPLR